ncbi:MAG: hypothetical protein ACRD2T_13660, partial [Thermoanaerobaculia bacterium]
MAAIRLSSGLAFVLGLAFTGGARAEERSGASLPLVEAKAFDRAAAAHLLTRAGFAAVPAE